VFKITCFFHARKHFFPSWNFLDFPKFYYGNQIEQKRATKINNMKTLRIHKKVWRRFFLWGRGGGRRARRKNFISESVKVQWVIRETFQLEMKINSFLYASYEDDDDRHLSMYVGVSVGNLPSFSSNKVIDSQTYFLSIIHNTKNTIQRFISYRTLHRLHCRDLL